MVPTDGSPHAIRAEDTAIGLARDLGSVIVAVHIIDEQLIEPFEILEEEGEEILNNFYLKGKEMGVKVDKVLLVGHPSQDMAKITEKTGADLLVMGTHGRSGLVKLIMGSVAENALKTVDIPLLLVK